ncbi:hypothetical protein RUND412_004051 [Rhizina undulata]
MEHDRPPTPREREYIPALLASPNIRLLFLQRFVRLFAYAQTTLILALFFTALSHPPSKIGLFMTLTLYGDVLISLFLTMFADRVGRRNTLLIGAALMGASGVVFATCENYWVLLFAAILGVISPSGNEIGPFRAVEESTLSQLVDANGERERRTEVFAWYGLVGALGSAMGSVTAGWMVQGLETRWGSLSAYRAVWWFYTGFAAIKFLLAWRLDADCEAEGSGEDVDRRESWNREFGEEDDSRRLLAGELEDSDEGGLTEVGTNKRDRLGKRVVKLLLPNVTRESMAILWKLCLLFAIDSTASGLAPSSWLTFFFNSVHHISPSTLGTLFFTTSILAAISSLFASPLSKRLGLIRTMVYTHLPSAIFLTLIPIPSYPSGTWAAMLFLILRSTTSSMDQAPRTAFLAAVMLPEERTAVMGIVNTVKTLSQATGPVVTGVLGARGHLGVGFIVAGALKICYDLGLAGTLIWMKVGGERVRRGDGEARERERERESDEEGERRGLVAGRSGTDYGILD